MRQRCRWVRWPRHSSIPRPAVLTRASRPGRAPTSASYRGRPVRSSYSAPCRVMAPRACGFSSSSPKPPRGPRWRRPPSDKGVSQEVHRALTHRVLGFQRSLGEGDRCGTAPEEGPARRAPPTYRFGPEPLAARPPARPVEGQRNQWQAVRKGPTSPGRNDPAEANSRNQVSSGPRVDIRFGGCGFSSVLRVRFTARVLLPYAAEGPMNWKVALFALALAAPLGAQETAKSDSLRHAMMRVMLYTPQHLLVRKDALGLTGDQVTRLTALRDGAKTAHDAAMGEAKAHMQEFEQAANAPAPDTSALKVHFQAAHAAMGKAHWLALASAVQGRAVLTDAQRTKLKTWADSMQTWMEQHRQMMHPSRPH